MSEKLLKIEVKSSAPRKQDRVFFEGIIEQLEHIFVIEGNSDSAAAVVIEEAKEYLADNPVEETVELPANTECRVLTIGEVQEAIVEANGKQAHVSLQRYGIPDTFLRKAVPVFEDIPHNYMPALIKYFEAINPIAALDAREMFTIQGQKEQTGTGIGRKA